MIHTVVWKTFICFIVNNLTQNQTCHYQDHLEKLIKVWQCLLVLLLLGFEASVVPCVWFWTGIFSWFCLKLLLKTCKMIHNNIQFAMKLKYVWRYLHKIKFAYSLLFLRSEITSSDCCCLSSEFLLTFSKVVSSSAILDFISSFLFWKLASESKSAYTKK